MTHGELVVVLEEHGQRVRCRPGHNGWMAQCPAHGDRKHLSLAVSVGRDGRSLMHCFAGCSFEEVRRALDLPCEAFSGWRPYNRKRLCRKGSSDNQSLTLIVMGVLVPNAKALLNRAKQGRITPTKVTIATPPKSGRVMKTVAADLSLIFGAADAAGHSELPVMYAAPWAAKRLGIDHGSVSRALRKLIEAGCIERAGQTRSGKGRPLHLYRLPREPEIPGIWGQGNPNP